MQYMQKFFEAYDLPRVVLALVTKLLILEDEKQRGAVRARIEAKKDKNPAKTGPAPQDTSDIEGTFCVSLTFNTIHAVQLRSRRES